MGEPAPVTGLVGRTLMLAVGVPLNLGRPDGNSRRMPQQQVLKLRFVEPNRPLRQSRPRPSDRWTSLKLNARRKPAPVPPFTTMGAAASPGRTYRRPCRAGRSAAGRALVLRAEARPDAVVKMRR